MQRETTYQQALKNFGIDVPLADIEKEFHLTDKLFMREYPSPEKYLCPLIWAW
jgi:putative hydrolase of the HAD superfamily